MNTDTYMTLDEIDNELKRLEELVEHIKANRQQQKHFSKTIITESENWINELLDSYNILRKKKADILQIPYASITRF